LAHIPEDGVQSDLLDTAVPMRRIESLVRALHEENGPACRDHTNIEEDGVVADRARSFNREEITPAREVTPSGLQRTDEVRQALRERPALNTEISSLAAPCVCIGAHRRNWSVSTAGGREAMVGEVNDQGYCEGDFAWTTRLPFNGRHMHGQIERVEVGQVVHDSIQVMGMPRRACAFSQLGSRPTAHQTRNSQQQRERAFRLPTDEAPDANSQVFDGLLETVDERTEVIDLVLNADSRSGNPHKHPDDDLLLYMQWQVAKSIVQ
jgi:hypothetical protein